jgi:hypothetical protein
VPEGRGRGPLREKEVAPHQFGQKTYVRAISAGANLQA